jgi:hypothetical protein
MDTLPVQSTRSPSGLLALAAFEALLLLAVLLLTTALGAISRQASVLTSPAGALPAVAASAAVFLVLIYPLWPSRLLGGADPLEKNGFWSWAARRAAEAAIVLAVATPFLCAAAVFSGESFWRVGAILAGLAGTAVAAIVYRFVHLAGSRVWRIVALADAVAFVFGLLVVGYLVLEFYDTSIGWGWLISPAALGRELALGGLAAGGESFWVGLVGYTAISLAALALLRPPARKLDPRPSAVL